MPKPLPLSELKKRIERAMPGKFEVISTAQPKSVHDKITVICNSCKNTYDKRVNDLLHGYGCRYCSGQRKNRLYNFYTTETFIQKITEMTDGEYQFLSEFQRMRDKGRFRHTTCGNKFDMSPHAFVTLMHRCPFCSTKSFGKRITQPVRSIITWLEKKGLKYELEKRFDSLCIYGPSGRRNRLPFDVFIEELNLLIEYDGEQHFRPANVFGGEKRFLQTQCYDELKNNWAKESNYSLLRISYKEKNRIPEILDDAIGKQL